MGLGGGGAVVLTGVGALGSRFFGGRPRPRLIGKGVARGELLPEAMACC